MIHWNEASGIVLNLLGVFVKYNGGYIIFLLNAITTVYSDESGEILMRQFCE